MVAPGELMVGLCNQTYDPLPHRPMHPEAASSYPLHPLHHPYVPAAPYWDRPPKHSHMLPYPPPPSQRFVSNMDMYTPGLSDGFLPMEDLPQALSHRQGHQPMLQHLPGQGLLPSRVMGHMGYVNPGYAMQKPRVNKTKEGKKPPQDLPSVALANAGDAVVKAALAAKASSNSQANVKANANPASITISFADQPAEPLTVLTEDLDAEIINNLSSQSVQTVQEFVSRIRQPQAASSLVMQSPGTSTPFGSSDLLPAMKLPAPPLPPLPSLSSLAPSLPPSFVPPLSLPTMDPVLYSREHLKTLFNQAFNRSYSNVTTAPPVAETETKAPPVTVTETIAPPVTETETASKASSDCDSPAEFLDFFASLDSIDARVAHSDTLDGLDSTAPGSSATSFFAGESSESSSSLQNKESLSG